jgi:toxin-antitoxin system PIN domain toxin
VVALLDVNVLIALIDPYHIHHEAADNWFADNRQQGWATSAITENGLLRVICNPSYQGTRATLKDGIASLRRLCEMRGHVFWSELLSIRDSRILRWNHVQGHRQLTDLYLLALAVVNRGRLATFDSAISILAISDATAINLEIIPS